MTRDLRSTEIAVTPQVQCLATFAEQVADMSAKDAIAIPEQLRATSFGCVHGQILLGGLMRR